ncbi:MAG: PEP/pyruvate-binding domain-containing protein [Candidatus Edwardsbacteria bacterium]|nr:PEP/pyruvate-binding domain-containing protein [Candidatus Edwardsbacteria bacterium]
MPTSKPEWQVIVDLLRDTNPILLNRIGRKMMNYLYKRNVRQIEQLMQQLESSSTEWQAGENQPVQRLDQDLLQHIMDEVFRIAAETIPDEEITTMVTQWLKYEQFRFLSMAAEKRDVPLVEITEAVHRFARMPEDQRKLAPEERTGIRVALIRRFFSDDLDYINVTKKYSSVSDFGQVLSHTVGPALGNGKLGGKAAGLFRAEKVLLSAKKDWISLRNLAVPKTWYITSDGSLDFLHFNALEEMPTIKYRDPMEIRQEFPYLEQIFKNSALSPEITARLFLALDDFGDKPLIVRSSSLLEDTLGSAFAGKYKSLFVANQGTKRERLEALTEAIVEVYASVFGPDPIEYRRERGLLDFNEEMAILIQEVVGRRCGKYYLPAYAGVAFSYNEFRWSPRIKRGDGIIRLVAGLGTRAVDRVGDDYPVLISPGQPGLRVNVSPDEVLWYSQKNVDVINIETRRFETMTVERLVAEVGHELPALSQIISIHRDGELTAPTSNLIDLSDGTPVVTFAKLLAHGPFIPQIRDMLKILQETLGFPVDIEFACDGDIHKLYLLQCRPQSQAGAGFAVSIPKNVAVSDQLFSAGRYITNALVKDVEYLVYVDPDEYENIPTMEELIQVGRIVGELNLKLPRQKFILMGPGRWGSRGDVKLGVKVGYADINNTAMLIEVAKKKKDYVPELSFGTHFFQDLVEANIKYLPLYPDETGAMFNQEFFKNAPNVLRRLVPGARKLEHVIKVIHVPKTVEGATVSVYMDGEHEQALAVLERK